MFDDDNAVGHDYNWIKLFVIGMPIDKPPQTNTYLPPLPKC